MDSQKPSDTMQTLSFSQSHYFRRQRCSAFLLQSTLIVNGLGAHTEVGTVKKIKKVFLEYLKEEPDRWAAVTHIQDHTL